MMKNKKIILPILIILILFLYIIYFNNKYNFLINGNNNINIEKSNFLVLSKKNIYQETEKYIYKNIESGEIYTVSGKGNVIYGHCHKQYKDGLVYLLDDSKKCMHISNQNLVNLDKTINNSIVGIKTVNKLGDISDYQNIMYKISGEKVFINDVSTSGSFYSKLNNDNLKLFLLEIIKKYTNGNRHFFIIKEKTTNKAYIFELDYNYKNKIKYLSNFKQKSKKIMDKININKFSVIPFKNQREKNIAKSYLLTSYYINYCSDCIENEKLLYKGMSGIDSILYGKGVCDAYSKIFIYLLETYGIKGEKVSGMGCSNGKCQNHAWVKIKNENKYLYYDPTFDDYFNINYVIFGKTTYFGLDKEIFTLNHIENKLKTGSQITDNDNNDRNLIYKKYSSRFLNDNLNNKLYFFNSNKEFLSSLKKSELKRVTKKSFFKISNYEKTKLLKKFKNNIYILKKNILSKDGKKITGKSIMDILGKNSFYHWNTFDILGQLNYNQKLKNKTNHILIIDFDNSIYYYN